MKKLFIALLVFLASANISWAATSYTAATCSQANVQTAVTSCNGDAQCNTVTIPSGSCTWSSGIALNKAITVKGAGSTSTVITQYGSGIQLFNINSNSRITDIGFNTLGGTTIYINSGTGWRFDHNRITLIGPKEGGIYGVFIRHVATGNPIGLLDNNIFTDAKILVDRCADWKCQLSAWSAEITLGTADAVYIEDNTFISSYTANSIDSNRGGRWVARFNTFVESEIMAHGIGSNPQLRGPRSWEIYNNTLSSAQAVGGIAPVFLRAGTGVIFNNTISGTWTWTNKLLLSSDRSLVAYGTPCNGTSSMDGNTSGEEGWLCRDQSGAGRDNPASTAAGSYPNYVTTWGTQEKAPVYAWGNSTIVTTQLESWKHIEANRDYYDGGTWGLQTSSSSPFSGATGTGRGTYANRPATCTTGVAYWATDRGGNWNTINADANDGCLYKCTSTNTWASTCSYTPYIYPHPLQGGGYIPPEDTTPPTITSSSPSGAITYAASKDITVITNENAMCAYCVADSRCDSDATFADVYASAGNTFMASTGTQTHVQTVSVAASTEYNYYVSCRDTSTKQNEMTGVAPYTPKLVNFTTGTDGGEDTNAPAMSTPLPAGTVYPCGSNVTLSVSATDDSGTVSGCKYNTTDVAYASMSGTFDAPGGGTGVVADDFYSETNYQVGVDITLYYGYISKSAQSFTSKGGTLDSVKLYLSKTGSPSGNAVVKIYAHSGTYGTNSLPTGVALATSDNFDVSTLTTSKQLITFTFSAANRITLTATTQYVVTLEYVGGDVSNYVAQGTDNTSPTHSGNGSYYISSWTVSTRERVFYVYTSSGVAGLFSYTLTAPACGQSYAYYYRCTDGTTANLTSATATFTISGGNCPAVGCIEFEAGTNASPMVEYTDAAASGGQYVATTTDLQGTSTHSVVVATAGRYRVMGRVHATGTGDDSIFLSVDGGAQALLSLNRTGATSNWNTWREELFYGLVGGGWTEYQVDLTADTHSFVWTGREAGAKLDYFYLQWVDNIPPPPTDPKVFRIVGTGNTLIIGSGNTIIIE